MIANGRPGRGRKKGLPQKERRTNTEMSRIPHNYPCYFPGCDKSYVDGARCGLHIRRKHEEEYDERRLQQKRLELGMNGQMRSKNTRPLSQQVNDVKTKLKRERETSSNQAQPRKFLKRDQTNQQFPSSQDNEVTDLSRNQEIAGEDQAQNCSPSSWLRQEEETAIRTNLVQSVSTTQDDDTSRVFWPHEGSPRDLSHAVNIDTQNDSPFGKPFWPIQDE